MSWRFRQSFSIIPGLRLNLSKGGLSMSVGGAPFTMNIGPRGVYGTASLPGTGLSYRQRLDGGGSRDGGEPSPRHTRVPIVYPGAPIQTVASAPVDHLTSDSFKDLEAVLKMAHRQHSEISYDLHSAQRDGESKARRYTAWETGWLFKKLFTKDFIRLKERADLAAAKTTELREQLRLGSTVTHVEIADEQKALYFKMRADFATLAGCQAIWDITTHQATDRFRERTSAVMGIRRQPVRFSLGNCNVIEWNETVPCISNSKGANLYLYPGFIVYCKEDDFSVISFLDLDVACKAQPYHEDEHLPGDTQIIGTTWLKANKNGSRDMRFVSNREIPIVKYGQLVLKSNHGLWEEFHFSNLVKLLQFCNSWNAFTGDLRPSADPQGKPQMALPSYHPETLAAVVIPLEETTPRPAYVPAPTPAVTIDDGSMLQVQRWAWALAAVIVAILVTAGAIYARREEASSVVMLAGPPNVMLAGPPIAKSLTQLSLLFLAFEKSFQKITLPEGNTCGRDADADPDLAVEY